MRTHKVEYYRSAAIIAIILIVPLFFTGIFLFIILSKKDIPGWLVLISSCLLVLVSMMGTLFMYKRYGAIPTEVQMNDEGIEVKLLRHSFLYSVSHFSSNWNNIENVSTNYDPNHNKRFYKVTFKNPQTTINLIPIEHVSHAHHETEFGSELMAYVEKFNEQHLQDPAMQIHSRGFYKTVFAKILTLFAWVAILVTLAVRVISPEKLSFWRLVAILTYAGFWLVVYYLNTKKE